MKKITLVLMFALLSLTGMAQENSAFVDRMMLELGMGTSTANDNTTVFLNDIKVGYKITPYLNVFTENENGMNVMGKGDIRNVYGTNTIGGGVGFDFLGSNNSGATMGIRASVGTTLGNADHKQTVFKAGLYLRLGKDKIHPIIEAGYRAAHSRTTSQPNVNGIYAKIGICW